jgi:hypothetical protein
MTLLSALAPSTMNSRQTFGVEPALDQIVDQRLHDGGILGRAFDQPPTNSALCEHNPAQSMQVRLSLPYPQL